MLLQPRGCWVWGDERGEPGSWRVQKTGEAPPLGSWGEMEASTVLTCARRLLLPIDEPISAVSFLRWAFSRLMSEGTRGGL